LDPLVVYKGEAFTKFQTLLYRLHVDITTYVAGIDFASIQDQSQVVLEQPSEASLLQMLQEVNKNIKPSAPAQTQDFDAIFAPNKAVYESNDEVEIFELDNPAMATPSSEAHKSRPNDPCPCGSGKKYKKCCGMK
jgi:uncharacterized protein YecA (UPF0149 family)